ncbi:MAG: hypothetical protein J3Q66DRAFT_347934 [Benniella sp.]|nr:MAG: hypothetical protein J3Q66DRAFT_347934 [Benniella sp.]
MGLLDPLQGSRQYDGSIPSEKSTPRIIFGSGTALGGTTMSSTITMDEHGGERNLRIDRISTPDRGRVMISASFIPKGTLIYRAVPQAVVCDARNRQRRCGFCLALLSNTQSGDSLAGAAANKSEQSASVHCRGCNEVWYCDEECRAKDWNTAHELECGFLKRLYHEHGQENTKESNDDIHLGEQHQRAIGRYKDLDSYDQDYCRLLLRVLVFRFKEYLQWPDAIDKDHTRHEVQKQKPLPFADVFDLVENRECFSKDKLEGDMTDVARVLDAMQEYLDQNQRTRCSQTQDQGHPVTDGQESVPRLTIDELLGLILKEECNSFGLHEYPTGNPKATSGRVSYGLGLFVRGYIHSYNHSCAHNLYHVAHNTQLLFYAARDILPGEELNIRYMEFESKHRILGDHAQPLGPEQERERRAAFEKRRAYLKAVFHFDCGCPRCMWEFSLDQQPMDGPPPNDEKQAKEEKFIKEGLLCEQSGCPGYYVPPEVLDIIRGESGSRQLWECIACGHSTMGG